MENIQNKTDSKIIQNIKKNNINDSKSNFNKSIKSVFFEITNQHQQKNENDKKIPKKNSLQKEEKTILI